ncbi:GNAT family N-acetyltransferase [Pantoea sp. Tr-811]|uniref:GNAT family N-acetyltransferase n=1 Tax=Pantoea sp. Tr-811 TaxID=2608361 RepID=UPI00141E7BA4|nr:GNAT family N-acetyltransferase [Pantoea sp. Tr-811]NIF29214.1 GNAT family N-acetyltransferase [Pantoea sp. Tr-811]
MTLSTNCIGAAPTPFTAERINGLSIKKATPFHARKLVDFFRRFEETSFCDWQDEALLKGLLATEHTYCYVAENPTGTIVGAVAGGLMGTRGTINHMAVAPDYRQSRIGTSLANSILSDFRQHGIRRVFLFVEDNNPNALNFWQKQGFAQTRGEITCEVDL